MNFSKNLASGLAFLLAVSIASCSSDPNPLDSFDTKGENSKDAKVRIQLTLNPSDTRAVSENAISSCMLYIFNEDETLEHVEPIEYKGDIELELDDVEPGLKWFYAITASDVFSEVSLGSISLTEFEKIPLDSKLSDIIINEEFVMAGKTDTVYINSSNIEGYIPPTNKFSISLQRLAAKVTVDATNIGIDSSNKEFTIGKDVSFKAFQTNKKMILSQSEYVYSTFDKVPTTDGTYSYYAFENEEVDYSSASISGSASSECQYMPENRVQSPVSGNTTFVGIKLQVIPNDIFRKISGSTGALSLYNGNKYQNNEDFYVYAIVKEDDPNTVIDYYRIKTSGKIKFYDEDAVGEETPDSSALSEGYIYKQLKFEGGMAYYRVNIKDSGKYQVLRNKAYTITLKTVNSLGAPSASALCPTNADTALDETSGISIVETSTSLTVEDWGEENQETDL